MIRLILNRGEPDDDESRNRYTRARDLPADWRREGILKFTQRPSFWVYEQEFDFPEIGRRKLKGYIGLVRLQDYERGRILPHEKILTRPLEDRIRLTQQTETQFEYIWGIYQDKACVDRETGVRHRMWRLLAPQACRIITGTMERLRIYITDGHHRYQAMLAIRDRLLHDLDLSRRSLADLNLAIQEHFHVKSYPFNGGNDAAVRRRWLRDLRDAEGYEELVEIDSSSTWKMLHANILNTLILKRIIGITEEELAAQINVEYTKDTNEALEAIRSGKMQVALILNSTRLQDIFTIAENRERMPRKSTYFYPKPLSGLVFFPMSGA